MMTAEMKQWIKRELPVIFREDVEIHQFILELAREQFADKRETESRFDRIMDELRRDRENDRKKWEEHLREEKQWRETHLQEEKQWRDAHLQEEKEWKMTQDRKWDEQNGKWDEQNRKWDENQKNIQQVLDKLDAFTHKYQSDIGAMGSRWGFQAEESFRNALKSILEQSFAVQVLNINEFDDVGEVFGHPDQVELDVIIKNGLLIICEIKSSMSRGDVYIFNRKVKFYERLHTCTATRRIIITPMIRDDARRVAAKLDIEVFSYAEDVKL